MQLKNLLNKTVIHATHRPEDLIPAFMEFLDQAKEATQLSVSSDDFEAQRKCVELSGHIDNFLGEMERALHDQEHYYGPDGWADLNIADLLDYLNELAPEGFYFGAHVGDGSDFGYWESEE